MLAVSSVLMFLQYIIKLDVFKQKHTQNKVMYTLVNENVVSKGSVFVGAMVFTATLQNTPTMSNEKR